MTVQQVTVPLTGDGSAYMILSKPLTPESLREVEDSLAASLARLRCEMGVDPAAPGIVEYESWGRHLRPAPQP